MDTPSFSELLKRSWDIYVNNFRHFFLLAVLFILPFQFVSAYVSPITFSSFNEVAPKINDALPSWIIGLATGMEIVSVIMGIFVSLVVMRITAASIERTNQNDLPLRMQLRAAWSRLLPAVGTSLLHLLFVIGLLILLIVPGVIFAGYWVFTIVAVALRDQEYFGALRMSRALVKGRWWQVVGRTFLLGLLLAPFIILVTFPIAGIEQRWLHVTMEIISLTVIEIISMLFTIFLVVYFLELEKTAQK